MLWTIPHSNYNFSHAHEAIQSLPIHIAIDLILLQKQGFLYFSLWPQTPLIYIVGVVSVIDQGNFHIMDNIEDFTVQCVV